MTTADRPHAATATVGIIVVGHVIKIKIDQ